MTMNETTLSHAEKLKTQALTLIQSIAGNTWTDHNSADPGITLLEVLALAVTDLGERLDLPVDDLLASPAEDNKSPVLFFTPEQLLPSNPVTLADHRRAIIDIDGVVNANLKRRIIGSNETKLATGVFDILLDLDDTATDREAIKTEVRQRFLSQRNVNEDIATIRVVDKHPVTIALNLSLNNSVEPMQVIAEVLSVLQKTLAPVIKTQRYQDLQAQGLAGDVIFDGPLLSQGFITQQAVEDLVLPEAIYASDILSALDKVDSIKTRRAFSFVDSANEVYPATLQWRLDIAADSIASLDVCKSYYQLEIDIDGQAFNLPTLDDTEILELLHVNIVERGNGVPVGLAPYLTGRYQALKNYDSLQHRLPALYGLAEQRLNGELTDPVLADIVQFKGYLSLFDQVLADQYAQLDLLKQLLALPDSDVFNRLAQLFNKMLASETISPDQAQKFWQNVAQLPHSHVSQPVIDISGTARLLGDYFSNYQQQGFQRYAESDFSERQLQRLKQGFEHLLSRFAETTLDANLLKYHKVFSAYSHDLQCAHSLLLKRNALGIHHSGALDSQQLLANLVQLKQVVDLAMLLNDYPLISRQRTGGFNYLSPLNNAQPMSGLVRRLQRFLGMSSRGDMPLATNNKEGFYLVESELIRFSENEPNEYYSPNELYFVAPAWPTRFSNSEFRILMEQQILANCPVYQQPFVIYLARDAMSLFERLYFAWLNAMSQLPLSDTAVPSLLVGKLSSLLRAFFKEPESLTDLLLQAVPLEVLKQHCRSLLVENLREQLTGDDHASLLSQFFELAVSPDISISETLLIQQLRFSLCQLNLDIISQPTVIKHATIGTSFQVGYRALDYLKPTYVLGAGTINPAIDNEPTFTLAISQPHSI